MKPRFIKGEKRKYPSRRYEVINDTIYRVRTSASGSLKLKPIDKLKGKNETIHSRTDTTSISDSTRQS